MKWQLSSLKTNVLHHIERFYIHISYIYVNKFYPILKIIFFFISILSIGILIYEYGYGNLFKSTSIQFIVRIIIYYFIFYEGINLFFYREEDSFTIKEYFKKRKIEVIIAFIVLLLILFENYFIKYLQYFKLSSDYIVLFYLSISQIFILLNNFLHFSRNISNIKYKQINPSFVFLISFIFVIFIGIILLSSPNAHNKDIPLVDIVFTVVSATCVTGLSTIDVGTDLNLAGQIILLSLIQIGGLGLMTLTSFFSYYLSGQVSLTNQIVMRELFSEISLDKVKNTLRNVTIFTFLFEAIGTIYLYFSLPDDLIPSHKSKFFYALFHSISAFCNAGFSLFSDSLYQVSKSSFISIYGIMFLIIFGGIGFPVIHDVIQKIKNKKYKISLTTRIVLMSNIIIWFFAFLVFLFFSEFYHFNLNWKEKVLHGLFYSITPEQLDLIHYFIVIFPYL
ncbi:MAG: hypothetical protein KatS3mg129_0866 [Leptospiraceae bacterium]|nr:MAG: hypothetical protein KatS3mg129_0866 [Leptospiraceae bacterium]